MQIPIQSKYVKFDKLETALFWLPAMPRQILFKINQLWPNYQFFHRRSFRVWPNSVLIWNSIHFALVQLY